MATKRPHVPHTKSSLYRPMTQMNGDYLTQLKKPICSELNPDFKGSTRAREAHCKQLVSMWYNDQQFLLRKLNRDEEDMYELLLSVQREKRRLQKEAQSRRESCIPEIAESCTENAADIPEADIRTIPETGVYQSTDKHVAVTLEKDTYITSNGRPEYDVIRKRELHAVDLNDQSKIQADLPVIPKENVGGKKSAVNDVGGTRSLSKSSTLSRNLQGSGCRRLVKTQNYVATEVLPISPLPEVKIQSTMSSNGVSDKTEHPQSDFTKNRGHVADELAPRLHCEETDLYRDYDIPNRSQSEADIQAYKDSRKRQSVGLILIKKHMDNVTNQQRKQILDKEKLQLYDRNKNGEIVPAFRTFKRKTFTIPTLREVKQRERLLDELRHKQDEQVENMQQFLTKVEEEKGKPIQSFRPRRQATKDDLILKEQSSAGMVSLQRLAAVFNHRNESGPLPKGVEPGSIESMRQCSYLRTFHLGDNDGVKKSMHRHTKHIFAG